MLRAISGQANPKYTDTYVVTAKGYFGDGDEDFNMEESSAPMGAKAGEKAVELFYKASMWQKEHYKEMKSQMPEEYRDYIRGVSWDDDVLPRIEEISLKYYDQFGNMHDVEVS